MDTTSLVADLIRVRMRVMEMKDALPRAAADMRRAVAEDIDDMIDKLRGATHG